MPAISVIVPIYKVEEYLPECINSILNQTFTDFELILVDDGSPDQCGEICDDYAVRDKRIRVIHQENMGLSGARNTGMDIARGKYITFVDSDDIIVAHFLASMYQAIATESADMAIGVNCNFEHGKLPTSYYEKPDTMIQYSVYDGRTSALEVYRSHPEITISAIGKLFARELISNMRFPVGRVHEDQAFVPLAYYNASKVVFTGERLYYYRVRSGSITHEKFSNKRYDDLWAIENCIRYFEERGEQEILKAARDKRMRLICVYAIYARHDHVTVPQQYRIPIFKALLYLRRHVSNDKYAYYLGKVNINYVRWHEYVRKAESIVRKLLRR